MPGRRLALVVLFFSLALAASSPLFASASTGGASQLTPTSVPQTPFDRQGMWIGQVARSEGGSAVQIVDRAKRAGIGTVYIKAGDGGSAWGQFSDSLVDALHDGGLEVCAWQFVNGDSPLTEARVGIAAVAKGADCLAIEAGGQYEGEYAAADTYIHALRAVVGPSYPLSLATFPYVDYHPSFPYSVFLGPGGATFVQPQMHWKQIGTSVRSVYERTYLLNRLWGHPIYPVGQTYGLSGGGSILRFRRFAQTYGGLPPSWWDWQETTDQGWSALGTTSIEPFVSHRPVARHPILRRGSGGDLVVWAQEHLLGAGAQVPVSGFFRQPTYKAVRDFQRAKGLPVDGVIGTSTWKARLEVAPGPRRGSPRAAGSTPAGGASANRGNALGGPASASLPARDDEIDPGLAT